MYFKLVIPVVLAVLLFDITEAGYTRWRTTRHRYTSPRRTYVRYYNNVSVLISVNYFI